MEQRTDHDILVCIEEKLKELKIQFNNHLRHHWTVTIACLSAGIIGMINLGIAMTILFFRV